jgi:hypothetical protein
MFELAGSFYRSYFMADEYWKTEIIKKLMFQLFIDHKKELRIEESSLFQSSKMLKVVFGSLTEIRTPVLALRRQCPNP